MAAEKEEAAVGGSGAEVEEERAKARTVPDYGDLRPAKYITDEFEPAFTFEVVGEGWVVSGSEERGLLDMRQGAGRPGLSVVNDEQVFNPSKVRELKRMLAPKDTVAWLRQHSYLQSEEPQSATIGGVEGLRFDAVVASVPATEFEGNCLGLFTANDAAYDWVVYEKKLRFIVLEGVGGERVSMAVEAYPVDFEEFLPKAHKVLKTVEWEGA